MDDSGSGFNVDRFRHYIPDLSVLYFYKFRNWASLLVLYAKICNSTFDFVTNYSNVLLPKKNDFE